MHMDSGQETIARGQRDSARAEAFSRLEAELHQVYGMARVLELASDNILVPGASGRDLNAFGNCMTILRQMAEGLLDGYNRAYHAEAEQVG